MAQRLVFCAKMGSSERVKSLHIGFFRDLVALTGGLLRGGAQRQPRVFLGRDLKLHTRKRVSFFARLAAKAAHFVIN